MIVPVNDGEVVAGNAIAGAVAAQLGFSGGPIVGAAGTNRRRKRRLRLVIRPVPSTLTL